MKRLGYISFRLLILIAVLYSFNSCIKEDLENCAPEDYRIKVYFSYLDIADNAPKGITPSEVDRIKFFVFDGNKKFYGEWDDNTPVLTPNYNIPLQLPPDTYTFVAWGGNLAKDFKITPSMFVKGVTNINDALLQINRLSSDTIEKITHNLFFASLDEAIVTKGNETFVLPLKQHTNKINVTFSNIDMRRSYQMVIEDTNGLETFTNMFGDNVKLNYKGSTFVARNSNQIYTSLTIMRLGSERQPRLVLYDTYSKRKIFDEDLVRLLLDLKRLGAPVDFDDIYEYNIDITMGAFDITITIGEWTISRSHIILD